MLNSIQSVLSMITLGAFAYVYLRAAHETVDSTSPVRDDALSNHSAKVSLPGVKKQVRFDPTIIDPKSEGAARRHVSNDPVSASTPRRGVTRDRTSVNLLMRLAAISTDQRKIKNAQTKALHAHVNRQYDRAQAYERIAEAETTISRAFSAFPVLQFPLPKDAPCKIRIQEPQSLQGIQALLSHS